MNTDIIIPIYNAFEYVKKCIETVIKHTDLTKHTLLLINDKSTDKRIPPLLNSFVEKNKGLNIILINNEENQGFVRTVNIGMNHSHKDVILLNSDTEVTKNWLVKMQNCAYSKPATATVTPLSNNASLASVPNFMEENILPLDLNVDEYAAIVEQCSMNLFPEIPTANGFCMYIKRESIDCIGLFDEKTFGKGYGEENDFSYRCLQAGYRHLLCDNTYIYHKGTQSFSKEKTELINSHSQILDKRYPLYVKETGYFVEQNPIAAIQLNIRYATNSHSKKNILVVIHDFKEAKEGNIGGTTLHARDLIYNMKEEFNFHVLHYSSDDNTHYLTSLFPSNEITIPLGTYSYCEIFNFYNSTFKAEIEKLFSLLRIDLIHIHHLKNMYLDIFTVAEEKNTPIIYSLHDFYTISPSIILAKGEDLHCQHTHIENSDSCINKKNNFNVNFMPLWRKEFHKALKIAKKIVVPSHSTKNIILDVYNDLSINIIEHGYDTTTIKPKINLSNVEKNDQKKFNIAFVGYIREEKGLKYLKELISKVANTEEITIHLFGTTDENYYNRNRKNYICHGKYLQKDLPDLLHKNEIKLACLMSICHETYSYTLTESLIAEIPVLAFDLGAIAERIKAIDAGWILPISSTTNDILERILTIKMDSTGEYKQKVENIRQHLKSMKSLKSMANEYADIYKETIKTYPITNHKIDYSQLKFEYYQKRKEQNHSEFRKLMEEKREFKRITRMIKNSSYKEALKDVLDYRCSCINSKYRNKILLKFLWYQILKIR